MKGKSITDARGETAGNDNAGLRVGIEIHQRLDTKKLFCSCDSRQRNQSTSIIERRLRAVPGELGDVDPAALHEFKRNKIFVYKISPGESCLVEQDDEPPHPMNQDALQIGLQVCKLLNCDVPDEIYVMRKTVIDGSNTGGFQRTAIIGMNGRLETSFGMVDIFSVCLEEEAARIEDRQKAAAESSGGSRAEGKFVYRLSGLGVPLVEITTSSNISTPEQAHEVAEKLGMLLRATKVQRGIGSIRQDVNISILGGERIEVKGFQELREMTKLIENETARQKSLLEIKNELIKRGSKISDNSMDVTEVLRNSKSDKIRKTVLEGGRVYAASLSKFAGLMKKQCGDRSFGKELSSYVESYGLGLIHSDEVLPDKSAENSGSSKFPFLLDEFEELRKKLKSNKDDLIFISAGKDADKACRAVIERAKQCLTGVPKETRIADGIGSKFTRPLPGSARMYPETDISPIKISRSVLDQIEIPRTLEDKAKDLKKILSNEMVSQLIHSKEFPIFEELSKEHNPLLAATMLTSYLTDLRRKKFDVEKLTDYDFHEILYLAEKGAISKNAVQEAMLMRIEGISFDEIKQKLGLLDEAKLEEIIKKIIAQNQNKGLNESAYMGLAMKEIKGRADGEAVIKIVRKLMK